MVDEADPAFLGRAAPPRPCCSPPPWTRPSLTAGPAVHLVHSVDSAVAGRHGRTARYVRGGWNNRSLIFTRKRPGGGFRAYRSRSAREPAAGARERNLASFASGASGARIAGHRGPGSPRGNIYGHPRGPAHRHKAYPHRSGAKTARAGAAGVAMPRQSPAQAGSAPCRLARPRSRPSSAPRCRVPSPAAGLSLRATWPFLDWRLRQRPPHGAAAGAARSPGYREAEGEYGGPPQSAIRGT